MPGAAGKGGTFRLHNGWTHTTLLRRLAVLWTTIGILLLLWILGFAFQVGGGLIHALLVIALVVFVINLISGRRAL